MNEDIKRRWVAALRSGDYAQGIGKLRDFGAVRGQDTYCCLGVLCDLAVTDGVATWEGSELPSAVMLPEVVREWAGLDSIDPVVKNDFYKQGVNLTTANDTGETFAVIANLIEESL